MELLRGLAEDGEAKLEVTVRIVREPKADPVIKPVRPYDTEGRLDGYRGIAEFLHTSVGFVTDRVQDGQIRTYRIGRKVYAYMDEVMEDIAYIKKKSVTVSRIINGGGYDVPKAHRIEADA